MAYNETLLERIDMLKIERVLHHDGKEITVSIVKSAIGMTITRKRGNAPEEFVELNAEEAMLIEDIFHLLRPAYVKSVSY